MEYLPPTEEERMEVSNALPEEQQDDALDVIIGNRKQRWPELFNKLALKKKMSTDEHKAYTQDLRAAKGVLDKHKVSGKAIGIQIPRLKRVIT